MDNPEFQALLNSLKADLILYKASIKEVADEIIREGYSRYPVFVAHQHEVALGEVILDKNELATQWTINATALEELVEKKVVEEERVTLFKKNYKNPEKFICILMITPMGASFIYVPYTVKSPENPTDAA